ncbi:hypothetical protein CMUS01_05247 [Colletotrichum musicola]|uniref:Uncharacterized protein n=1 Tax=Colletotrichum musicola TaxID=2175873 RepID=A0A8H6NKL1_9PEZI|nr:hypothetical protein CMUS01_05247 [Colletotrichum musicola]
MGPFVVAGASQPWLNLVVGEDGLGQADLANSESLGNSTTVKASRRRSSRKRRKLLGRRELQASESAVQCTTAAASRWKHTHARRAGLKAIQGIWPPNDGLFMGNMTQARADSIEGVPRDDVPETSTSVLVNSETTTTATATNSLATHNYQAGCISHLRLASRPTNIPTYTQARRHAGTHAREKARAGGVQRRRVNMAWVDVQELRAEKRAGYWALTAYQYMRDVSSAGQDAEDEFGGVRAVGDVVQTGQNLDERKAEEINQSAEIAARIRLEVAFEVGVEVEVDEVKVGHAVR